MQQEQIAGEQPGEIPGDNWAPRATRTTTTLLVARLLRRDAPDNLCRVRNLSEGGMMIESQSALDRDEPIALELRSGDRLEGRVVWVKPGRAGVQFARPINVEEVLHATLNRPPARGTRQPRAPRFAARCPARVKCGDKEFDVRVDDLSQSGARVCFERIHKLDAHPILSIPGLAPHLCSVRWIGEGEAGLSFVQMLTFNDLAQWLGQDALRFGEAAA